MKMKKRILAAMTAAMCCIGTLSATGTVFAYDPTPQTMIRWYMEENGIEGKTYNFIKNGNDALCIEVETLAEAEKIKAYIEECGYDKEAFGLFAKEDEGTDLLKSKEENIINVAGFISQYMEQNNIEGFIYPTEGNAEFIIVCKTDEGISQVKTFVKEKGYNADRLKFMLPDFEVNPPENVPESLEGQMGIIVSFMEQNKISGKAEICEYKGEKIIRVILDKITDQNTRTLEYFITQYGMDINKVLFDAVGYDAASDDVIVTTGGTAAPAEETIKGDANCDGEVSMGDAVLIMQSIANPAKFGLKGTDEHHITEQGSKNGDIAGDNDGITNADALAIQKKLLGLDKSAEKKYEYTMGWHMDDTLPDVYDVCMDGGKKGVVTNTAELKEYLGNLIEEEAISQYVEKYNDSFFENYVLLLDAINQGGGLAAGYKISSVNISDNIKIFFRSTIEPGTSVAAVMSICIAQVPVPKDQYNGQTITWKKILTDYDYDFTESEAAAGSVSTPQRLALHYNSFCKSDETLKVEMLMGDKYSLNQKFNYYPNYDSEGHPQYSICATEFYKEINDKNLVVNGREGKYIKDFSKDEMKSFDIEYGDYDTYYKETAEIDFSKYETGSTGCITFSFGWKADGENPLDPSKDYVGTSQSIYYYVGEDGVGISLMGWEYAEKVYQEKINEDVFDYDSIYVKWNGKEVLSDLHQKLSKENDNIIPIVVRLNSSPDYNFEYMGKSLADYDKEKNTDESHKAFYNEAMRAYFRSISNFAIEQLEGQEIKYKALTYPDRLVIFVTADEFKSLSLDNVSRYELYQNFTVNHEYTIDQYHSGDTVGKAYEKINGGISAVVTNPDELKEYLEQIYTEKVISYYLKKYSDSFFEDNILLLDTVQQPAGTEVGYKIDYISSKYNGIDITIRNTTDGGDMVLTYCLAQVVYPKNTYNGQSVTWHVVYESLNYLQYITE